MDLVLVNNNYCGLIYLVLLVQYHCRCKEVNVVGGLSETICEVWISS
jgi:hypothetical protein